MKKLITSLAGLLLLLTGSTAHEYSASGITVVHPWARATPTASRNGAVYFEIKATGASRGDRLVGGKSTAAERIEIHNHVIEKGIAKMRRVDGVAVRAGKSIILNPHGFHVMLIGLRSPLKEGEILPLTLVFERAGEITIEATIEAVGAMGPHGYDHQPTDRPMTHSH